MSDLEKLQNITHHYRKSLAAYEARTGNKAPSVDDRGSGEEKELFARMDADMSAIELRAQNLAIEARLAKVEKTPKFSGQVPGAATRAGSIEDPDSPAYAARWLKAMCSRDPEQRASLLLTSTSAAIPTDMERRIVMKMQQTNVMRSISKVSTIDSNRTIPVENALPTTALVGEAVTVVSYAPTFSTAISVVPYKYVTATTMSQEFIEDAIGTGNIGSGMDYVADRIAMSLSLKQEEAYTIGSGSGAPQGICVPSGITQVVDLGNAGTVASVTAANLIDLYHTVPVAYRSSPNFRWLVSDTLLKSIRKLTTTNGDFVFQTQSTVPGQMGVGFAQNILGVPVAVGQYVTATAANLNVYAVIGDFNYFEIFDRTGVTSFIDPYSQASSMQTTMYTYTRTDSHIMLPQAFAALTS